MSSLHYRLKKLFDDYSLHQVNEDNKILSDSLKKRSENDGRRRCAVLCCLREKEGELFVLVTTRANHLSSHPGEPCLPGGKEEQGDMSLEDTALREAEEEVGLKRKHVQTVATLPPLLNGNVPLQCYTVVSILKVDNADDLRLVASNEVNSIHWVPLRLFLGGGAHHWQGFAREPSGRKWSDDFFRVVDETDSQRGVVVWGTTAKICVIVASIVFSCPPTFPITVYYAPSMNDSTIVLKPFLINTIFSSKL